MVPLRYYKPSTTVPKIEAKNIQMELVAKMICMFLLVTGI